MKTVSPLKIILGSDQSQDRITLLLSALDCSNPQVRAWIENKIDFILCEIPFLESSIKASNPQVKDNFADKMLDAKQAGALLNIPPRWLYRYKELIPHKRFGRLIRFSQKDLLKWAEKRQNRRV